MATQRPISPTLAATINRSEADVVVIGSPSDIARLVTIDGNELIITHGNGPQVGLLALQSAAGPEGSQRPLDVLGAETEGMLGYLIEQELRNALPPGKEVVSVLSQVLVDPADPAFSAPTKPIGPLYSQNEAQRLSVQRGWSIVRDGSAWRRAVASPRPLSILELAVVALLASRGIVVICVRWRGHSGDAHRRRPSVRRRGGD